MDFLTIKELNINPRELSPLTLAYIGDAVFEVYARMYTLERIGNTSANRLNSATRRFVNAGAQARMFNAVFQIASEEELSVLKRGRNAKSQTTAKNQSVTDYRHATGLEALFGYLYLKGEEERLTELFDICIKENESEGTQKS